MICTTVYDNLNISLSEMKNSLRLNDRLVTNFAAAVNAGDVNVTVLDVEGIRPNGLYTIGIDEDLYKITNIDYATKTLTFNPPLLKAYSEKTPIWTHSDNALIIDWLMLLRENATYTSISLKIISLLTVLSQSLKTLKIGS